MPVTPCKNVSVASSKAKKRRLIPLPTGGNALKHGALSGRQCTTTPLSTWAE